MRTSSLLLTSALVIVGSVNATCNLECITNQCRSAYLKTNCFQEICGCPAILNLANNPNDCVFSNSIKCFEHDILSPEFQTCFEKVQSDCFGSQSLVATETNPCYLQNSLKCWDFNNQHNLLEQQACLEDVRKQCGISFSLFGSSDTDLCFNKLQQCMNFQDPFEQYYCAQQTSKSCMGSTSLYSDLSETVGCFENALTKDECEDLYKVAIGGGIYEDKQILKHIHGDHKDTMRQLLKNEAHRHELSLQQQNDSQQNRTINNRGFDIFEILSKKIVVNETALEDFFNDFYQLQMEYEALRQQKALEKQQFISDKYYETLAKVYVEFGKSVAPVVESYANVLEKLVPNSKCDKTCLIDQCLRPENTTEECIFACKCNFDAATITKKATAAAKEEAKLEAKVVAYLEDIQKQIQVKETAFRQKELQLTYKYYDLVEKHAVTVGGCDPVCVNTCTNPVAYNIHQVGPCLESCECSGGAIQILESDYSLENLSFLAGNDKKALSFLNKAFPL